MAALVRLVPRIIGSRRQNGPDRQRNKEPDCLKISDMSGRPAPLVCGIFLIRVSIYQGCDVSPDSSSYKTPKTKRGRSTAALQLGPLGISIMSCRSASLVFGLFQISVSIYHGASDSPDTSNYRMKKLKRTRQIAETGSRLSGNTRYVLAFRAVSFRGFPDPCKHLPGRFCFAR